MNPKLSAGQVSYLVDLHRNTGLDLQIILQDHLREVPADFYIENFKQLLAKLDTEYALYLHMFCNDLQPFFYNVLPLIKQHAVNTLNLSVKVLKQNKPVIKELSTLKQLTLRVSNDSE
jgi:hypothetical protein